MKTEAIDLEPLGDQMEGHEYKIYSFLCFFVGFVSLLMTEFSVGFYVPTALGLFCSYYFSRKVEFEDDEEGGSESED